MSAENILSIPKAAKHCALHRVTLWKYVKSGEIKAFKTPGGQHRIHKADLQDFMKRKGIYPYFLGEPKKKKVLIVDDDPKIVKMLQRALNGNGYEVDYASDGFESGLKTMKFKPDVVILDLFMPKIDGFEACKRIKEVPETANTKIIAISGFDTEENRQRIFNCGADLFFPKPLDIKNIKKEIGNILR
ncbi:MAG: response regulator [Deltaproteobacteria bacterium]|nr:response regulator [Deltaproteobacteria bacterium]